MKFLQRKLDKHFKTFLTAIALTLILYVFEEAMFRSPQGYYLALLRMVMSRIAPFHTFVGILSTILALFLTILFFYGALSSPIRLRLVYVVIFVLVEIVEYSFQSTLGRFTLAVDVQLGVTAPPKVWVDAGAMYLDWRALIPVCVFLLVMWKTRPDSSMRAGTLCISILLTVIAAQQFIPYQPFFGLNWGPSTLQGLNTLIAYGQTQLHRTKRVEITFRATDSPQNNIVLIIDESLRGDHLSVNGYARQTTPYLDELARQTSFLHNWKIAVPGATCSNMSNGLLITGLPIEPESLGLIYEYPTLFQYAKSMGYHTVYIDAQTTFLWNGVTSNDIQYIDTWIKATDLGNDLTSDFRAADLIRETLESSSGNFILLNKRGVHFAYEANYPPEHEIWSPIPSDPSLYESHPDQTINAYDNAIRYNVDGFMRRLFPDPISLSASVENSTFIYTSDHAETLFEADTHATHCSDTYLETRVPLIIFGAFSKAPDTSYQASHSNILPTILDLMEFPQDSQPYKYGLSLLEATAAHSTDRLFFNSGGTIHSHDELERQARMDY